MAKSTSILETDTISFDEGDTNYFTFGGGYKLLQAARSDGALAIMLGTPTLITHADATLAGLLIKWKSLLNYIYV